MSIRTFIIASICILATIAPEYLTAQTTREEMTATPEKCGGVYYAYPVTESHNTPAPKGFKPFYISHYGRHGSRYLISDDDYIRVIDLMKKAHDHHALTPLGEDVYSRLQLIWKEAEGRGGELTPLGVRQHKGIARRMYAAYPEVFRKNPRLTACSTQVMRCAHSMFAFCEALKEIDPTLDIPKESGKRNMYYLCHHTEESGQYNRDNGPWKEEYVKFEDEMTDPARLVKSLFKDDKFVLRNVNPKGLMWGLYWIAVDMQNMETPVTFMDIFEPDELFSLWQVFNYSFYIHNAGFPLAGGVHTENAKNLLRNIVETADEYIANGDNGATLRFGHDGNIVPLAALMQLNGCNGYEEDPHKVYRAWTDFKVSPMASNLQLIFFKDKNGEIIVKFLLNEEEKSIPAETDIYPFYRWEDARKCLQHLIDTPSTDFIPQCKEG